MYDGEIFIIPPDNEFHSLKSMALKSFNNNSIYYKYDSFTLYTTKKILVRINSVDEDTGDIELGGDSAPNYISIPSSFGIVAADIFIKDLEGTDTRINFLGRGFK
jgi:hypothetical protein